MIIAVFRARKPWDIKTRKGESDWKTGRAHKLYPYGARQTIAQLSEFPFSGNYNPTDAGVKCMSKTYSGKILRT